MTRKRFIKLRMGISRQGRNEAEKICKNFGRTGKMPYEILFRTLYAGCLSVKSKKQASYFGKPYLTSYDVKLIEAFVNRCKELNLQTYAVDSPKLFVNELKEYLLKNYKMWNYELIAISVCDVLSEKNSIENLKNSVQLIPWEVRDENASDQKETDGD